MGGIKKNEVWTEKYRLSKSTVLKQAILTVQQYLDYLRRLFEYYHFTDKEEKIWFFKVEKPRFVRWLIFYSELLNIDTTKPLGKDNKLKDQPEFLLKGETGWLGRINSIFFEQMSESRKRKS